MKLKYILPVATIASAATIVTPLVSCAKTSYITWDFAYGKEYVHSIEQASEDTDLSKIDETYFSFLSKDKNNLAYDYLLSYNDDLDGFKEAPKAIFKVHVSKIDVENQRVSMEIISELEGVGSVPSGTYMHYRTKINNFKWRVKYLTFPDSPEKNGWWSINSYMQGNDQWEKTLAELKKDNEWSMYGYMKAVMGETSMEIETNADAKNLDNLDEQKMQIVKNAINGNSWKSVYLKKVKAPNP